MKKLPTILISVVLAITGVVGYDLATISDKELQDYIFVEMINGRQPVIDISRVSSKRASKAALQVAEDLGYVPPKTEEEYKQVTDWNLNNIIREKAKLQGYDVKPSESPIYELKTKEEYNKAVRELKI